jgi:hypothetical protein
MYLSLTASEFLYVRELQRAYDETRCYFCQWVVTKEMKELINSARLTHINAGMDFNWTCVRREILNNLTDITHTARLLSLTQLERGQVSARLWVSQVTSKRALLEDKDLRHPILLPEIVYLELVLGRISPQEANTFEIPTLGDDLSATNSRGKPVWTLARIKQKIDACTQPPPFKGTRTPITDLIARPKPPKADTPEKKKPFDKTKSREAKNREPNQTKNAQGKDWRYAHEKPESFPIGLKRPDPKMIVDGRPISSEQQQRLYDDIKKGRCTRCHKSGHYRAQCPDKTPQKWEGRFDSQKTQYWVALANWQEKASPTTAKSQPTKTVKFSKKPQQHMNVLDCGSDTETEEEEDILELRSPTTHGYSTARPTIRPGIQR